MRIGLTARVVATVVVLAVSVVALDALVTRWAFQTRFQSYVTEQETEQLQALAGLLAQRYQSAGTLADIRSPRAMLRVLRRTSPREDAEQRPRRPDRDPRTELGGNQHDHPATGMRAIGRLLPRLQLALPDGRVIMPSRAAMPPATTLLEALVMADGEHVATLALIPAREFVRERDRRFSRDHLTTITFIAAVAAVLAIIVGWWLSRRLIAPVTAIAAGARALAAGNFEVRLEASRGDELGELAHDFNRLGDALADARAARERWLADVAHELRTPVTVLRGEIDAIKDGVRPLDHSALASLDGEVERLTTLIDDLRQLTLADAGALAYSFSPIALAEPIKAALARFRSRFTQAGITLESSLPSGEVLVDADCDRLEQLLANLLENALRYTDPPGPVRLLLESSATTATITVEDAPPGVAAAELPELFERFRRIEDSRSRAHGGAGLGLAIAARIVAAHDGEISARASQLGGIAIVVVIPLHQNDREPS